MYTFSGRSLDLHNSKGYAGSFSALLQLLAAWQSQRFAYSCGTVCNYETAKPWHLVANIADRAKTLAFSIGVQTVSLSTMCLRLTMASQKHLGDVVFWASSCFGSDWWWKRNSTSVCLGNRNCFNEVELSSLHRILIPWRSHNRTAAKVEVLCMNRYCLPRYLSPHKLTTVSNISLHPRVLITVTVCDVMWSLKSKPIQPDDGSLKPKLHCCCLLAFRK